MSIISVIVPVYNVEKYLNRCVDSILRQTLSDIEIILVDDGSTDQSGNICDTYAEKDSRIQVIHKENGGLSSARNCGIEKAQSPYIGFIDSDDYIAEDMYEVLFNEIVCEEADIVMCGLYDCYEGKQPIVNEKKEKLVLNSKEAIKMVMEAKKTTVSAVNKLYKREIFETIRYAEGKIAEDAFAIVEVLMKANKIVYTSEQKYYYIHRKHSITTCNFREKDLDIIEAYKKNKILIENNFPEISDVAEMRYMWAHFWVLDKMMLAKGNCNKKLEKTIIKVLRKNCIFILRDSRFNKGRKIAMLMLMINKNLYKCCVELHKKEYID